MAKTPHEFYLKYVNKAVDVDGYYGAQCWDGYAQYSKELGYPIFHCTQSGYVKDIWNLRKTSGILKYFDEVQKPFQDGDVIVWKECTECPLSHIAIFRKDNGNGTFVALGQNQGGVNGAFNQRNFTYNGVMGGLRPKCYKTPAETVTWDVNGVLKVGDKCKSISMAIQGLSASKTMVRCDALGGYVPLADVSEASDTKDGKNDGYLANTKARVTLDESTVLSIPKPGYVKIRSASGSEYVVKAAPLTKRC